MEKYGEKARVAETQIWPVGPYTSPYQNFHCGYHIKLFLSGDF